MRGAHSEERWWGVGSSPQSEMVGESEDRIGGERGANMLTIDRWEEGELPTSLTTEEREIALTILSEWEGMGWGVIERRWEEEGFGIANHLLTTPSQSLRDEVVRVWDEIEVGRGVRREELITTIVNLISERIALRGEELPITTPTIEVIEMMIGVRG